MRAQTVSEHATWREALAHDGQARLEHAAGHGDKLGGHVTKRRAGFGACALLAQRQQKGGKKAEPEEEEGALPRRIAAMACHSSTDA